MRALFSKKWLLLSLSVLIAVMLVLSGCGTKNNSTTVTQPAAVLSRPHPTIRTGDINTGPEVEVATQSIDSSGGMVAVSNTGGPLDGFVIDVPPGSYSGINTFDVSYATITSQTFGSDIDPISPMISVDNGGTYSSELMFIRVPVNVPTGDFAMGFYYDATTKQLEGMPLLSTDTDSITVGAMHFSDFFISMISKTLLSKDIDSGFRPGIDDWEFTNYGSYITPDGECEGQSLTALWYYDTQPDGQDLCLYGRYDNNGNQPATPDFWQDDSLGYRFVSVAQADIDTGTFANNFWLNLGGKNWVFENNKWNMVNIAGISNEATWDLFAYSIQATHEPQLVVIWSADGGGHAMIVYRINGGNLYIADPNYPGNTDRRIIYSNGTFQQYNSGANATEIAKGNGEAYDNIQYYAESTVLPWDQITQLWTQFKNGTIGTIGTNQFPTYNIYYEDSEGNEDALQDGYVSSNELIHIGVASPAAAEVKIYREGVELQSDDNGDYQLLPGDNKLGVEIVGEIHGSDEYMDFKYIDVFYGATSTTSATGMLAMLQNQTVFGSNVSINGTITMSGSDINNGSTSFAGSVQTPAQATGIQWNGATFTGAIDSYGTTGTVTGTMSSDGNTLISLNVNAVETDPTNTSAVSKWTYTISNLPIKWTSTFGVYDINAAGLDSYVTSFEYQNTSGNDTSTIVPDWSDTTNMISINFGQ
jgi:hypothetical protein